MKKKDLSYYTLLVIFMILASVVFTQTPHKILSWDIFGYYLYLPFTFIYNDLGLKDFAIVQGIIDKYQNTGSFYQALQMPEGIWVMKYPMGMALLYLPWFFVGHLWALLGGYDMDGFSLPYQMSLLYGSFVYTIAGLIIFRKSLLRFFEPLVVSIVLLSIVFGTNFLVLMVFHGQGLMSHNYLFFLFSLVLWFTIKWHEKPSLKYAAGLGAAIGIAALSRPTEILVAGIPLLWQVYDLKSLNAKIKLMKVRWKDILLTGILIVFFGSFQLVYYKVVTGKFLFNSYGGNAGEGMEFLRPFIWQFLFSYRKGWLLYTPLMALSLIGFIFLLKYRKQIFFSIFLFFLLSFYVMASWSCWWYADSFSQRAVIPMYVFLTIPLGMFVAHVLKKTLWIKIPFFLLVISLMALNLFQSWQFLHGMIHSSRMTKEVYHATFLKKWVAPEMKDMLLLDRNQTPEQILQSGRKFNSRLLVLQHYEQEGILADSSIIPSSGNKMVKLTQENPFSPFFEISYNDITDKEFGVLRIIASVFITQPVEKNPFFITAAFMHNGYAYQYKNTGFSIDQLNVNQWNKIEMYYLTPEVRNPDDFLRINIWLKGVNPIYVDEVKVEVFEPVN
ncbi:MAG: hypothetical protein CVT92_14770 [Bacteroidetes bacterium HGW-Bacteroidetes-1]|jgi:hypothetical protein|nr:MAG: hypothetical protein CVT92_14770 [Bacteroidetes bacterium HGW-Bacteroidetes-1]